MNNEKLKQQIRDLAIAADGLATAMHLFYANVSTEIIDDDIEAAEKEQSISLGEIDAFVYAIKKLKEKIAESDNHVSALLVPKLTAMYRLYHDILEILADNTHHCGQDADEFKQLTDDITDAYKDYCRGVLEQFLSREITWAKFVEKLALPFCHENINEFVNTDEQHHCCQDADDACCQARNSKPSPATISVQDPNESQPVDLPVSVKDLLGMQVVSVGNQPCDGCPSDNYGDNCVKVELVGGYMLCLSPLPNSIVTE